MEVIVKVNLENEMDLILAHKRAMKLAELTGHSLAMQTIFATAVSEISRCAIEDGSNASLTLGIDSARGNRKQIKANISDAAEFCNEKSQSLVYAKRLVHDVQLTKTDTECLVTLNYRINFPGTITPAKIASFVEYFEKEPPLSAYDELRKKNQQLQELAEKLRDSENDYRQLTDKLPLMMFAVNTAGDVIYTNGWLQDFLGLSQTSTASKFWQNFVHPEDSRSVQQEWDKAHINRVAFKMQARLKQRDGTNYVWHLISIVPVKNENNVTTKWIGFFADINAQKVVEETLRDNVELKNAQKELQRSNQELASFSYVASHDLQEPLRKIQTFSQRIIDAGEFNDKTKDYFHRINSAAKRMQNLIDSLLNFSRVNIEHSVFQTADLNDILQEALSNLKDIIEDKHATIEFDTLPAMRIIPVQFIQLLSNIIANGLKYSRPGVDPVIRIAANKIPGSEISSAEAKSSIEYWNVSISDNGIGFDQQYEDKIFELFQRLHGKNEYSGTGIGLAICKKIVQNHEGIITATGESGVGATFNIYIPIMN